MSCHLAQHLGTTSVFTLCTLWLGWTLLTHIVQLHKLLCITYIQHTLCLRITIVFDLGELLSVVSMTAG